MLAGSLSNRVYKNRVYKLEVTTSVTLSKKMTFGTSVELPE
jgi:hypothetical protein